MSSHKKSINHDRNKRHDVAQESQQLRRDVENLENVLMLHYRYQSETENSVRGMIRKEIAGSHWEHGGEGKLKTYRSNKDLIQPGAGHLRTEQGKRIRTSRSDVIDTGQSGKKYDLPVTAIQTKENKKSGQRLKSSESQKQKETSVKYKEVSKVQSECDKADWKKLEPAATKVISSDRHWNIKDDRSDPKNRELNPKGIKHLQNEDRLGRNYSSSSKAIKGKKSAQVMSPVIHRSTFATSPEPIVHLITAEVSRNFHKPDAGLASPVASIETSYSFSSPAKTSMGKVNSDQVFDSYGKTLEFLMSQFNTSHVTMQKSARRSDSAVQSDQKESGKHHRRHTAGGDSKKWADSTQGVSYLASKTWRYGSDDFYCDDLVQRPTSNQSLDKSDRLLTQSLENKGAHSARSHHSNSHKNSINNNSLQALAGSKGSPLTLQDRSVSNHTFLLSSSPTSTALEAATQAAGAVNGSFCPATLPGQNSINSCPEFNLLSLSSVTSHLTPHPTGKPFSSVLSERSMLVQTSQKLLPDTEIAAKPIKSMTHCAPEVVSWLSILGLHSVDDYIQLFSEHEMDMDSIRLLTTTTLRDMGINALGPIMKIMKGVEILNRGERSSSSIETSTRHNNGINTDKHEPSKWEDREETQAKDDQNHRASHELVTEENTVSSASCDGSSIQGTLKPDSAPSEDDARMKLHQDGCLTEREQKNGTDRSRVSRKSNKVRGKMPKVTGKPPPVGRLVDDGIAQAAQKYSTRQQQQWQREQAEEKNATLRKQVRDEMAAKHTLRRSSSMERTTNKKRKPTGLERSASFTSVKTTLDVLAMDQGSIEFSGSPEALSKQIVSGVTIISPLGNSTKKNSPSSRRVDDTMGSPHPRQKISTKLYSLRHPEENIDDSGRDQVPGLHTQKKKSRSPTTSSDDETSPHVSARRRTTRERRRHRAAMGWIGDVDGEGLVLSASFTPREIKSGVPVRRSLDDVKFLEVEAKSPFPSSAGSTSETTGRNFSSKELHEVGLVFGDPTAESTRGIIPAQTVPPVKNLDYFKPAVVSRPGLLSTGFHIENLKKMELHRQAIDFSENDLLGDNVYSQVFKGSYQNKDVAVKRLKTPLLSRDKNYFAAEVSMFQELCHSNVVHLIGVCTTDKLPLVVFEYMVLGNLHTWLHDPSRPALEHKQFYQIARDISAGMLYLHQHQPPVLHLNLNSRNVLLGHGLLAKVADFGFSKLKHEADHKVKRINNKSKQIQGSIAWMAPELLTGSEVTAKADVYSFAVVLWEMHTRQTPYDGLTVYQILEHVRVNKRPPVSCGCPAELTKLIQRSWDPNPAVRPAFKELLKTLDSVSESQLWKIELNTDTNSVMSQKDDHAVDALGEPKLRECGKLGDVESKLEVKSISSETEEDYSRDDGSNGKDGSSSDDSSDFVSVTPSASSIWTITNSLDSDSTASDITHDKFLCNRTSSQSENTFINSSSASDIFSGAPFQSQTLLVSDNASAKDLPEKNTFPSTPVCSDNKSGGKIFQIATSHPGYKSTNSKTVSPHQVDSQQAFIEPLDLSVGKTSQKDSYLKPGLSSSQKPDTAHELIKKYLPKSLPATTKSYEPLLLHEKLLPLRHSLDKPQTVHGVCPEPTSKAADMSLRAANVLLGNAQTSDQISPNVLSADPGNIKRTVNPFHANSGANGFSSSVNSNYLIKKGTPSSYTEGQPYIPSFYTEVQTPNTRGTRTKNAVSKNSIGSNRSADSASLPDAWDKLDIKPPNEVLCNLSLRLSLDSHEKSSPTTHFASTPVSPKLTKPQHLETASVKSTNSSLVREKMSQQLPASDDNQSLESDNKDAIDKQGEADMLLAGVNPSKSPLTLQTETLSSVPDKPTEVVRNRDPSYDSSSQVLQDPTMNVQLCKSSFFKPHHPHHEKSQDLFSTTFQEDLSLLTKSIKFSANDSQLPSSSPVSPTTNSSIITQILSSPPVESQRLHRVQDVSNFKDSQHFQPVDAASDSEASTVQDDISEDSLSLGKNETFSPTVSLSPQNSSKSVKKSNKMRTSSPKPEPTRSTKYDHLQVAGSSPSHSPRRQDGQKYNRGRESFFLFNPSNGTQHFPMFRNCRDKTVETETRPLNDNSPSNSWSNETPRDSLEPERYARISENSKHVISKHEEFLKGVVEREQLVDAKIVEGRSIKTHMQVSHPHDSQMSQPQVSNPHHSQISQTQVSKQQISQPQMPQPQMSLQDRSASYKTSAVDGAKHQDPATVRFSLEANLLVKQKGQLKSVQTRVAPPVLKVISGADNLAQISVASILKKALTDRRFAMRDNHDSAEFTPDASWSTQDDDL